MVTNKKNLVLKYLLCIENIRKNSFVKRIRDPIALLPELVIIKNVPICNSIVAIYLLCSRQMEKTDVGGSGEVKNNLELVLWSGLWGGGDFTHVCILTILYRW